MTRSISKLIPINVAIANTESFGGQHVGGIKAMESDLRYYARRAAAEHQAAARAVTSAARDRRLLLAEQFSRKLAALQG